MTQEIARRLVMSATWKIMDQFDRENGGLNELTGIKRVNYLDRRMAYVNEHILDLVDKETAQCAV